MKSSAHAALASLKHKFQAKILEVGTLKRMVSEFQLASGFTEVRHQVQLERLNTRIEQLKSYSPAAVIALQAELNDSISYVQKLKADRATLQGQLRDSKSSVENWKSLTAILCLIGVVIGSLSTLAYNVSTLV
jgi:ribosome-interacting GTPase 1